MDLSLQPMFLARYRSLSQQARAITEDWAENNFYCPNCLEPRVSRERPGTKVIDFQCLNSSCSQTYQLKSQKQPFGKMITDAAYGPFLKAIEERAVPNLVLLQYDRSRLRVINVEVIPRFFLSQSSVIPRKPLSALAKRAYWVGCSISLERLPEDARVQIVRDEKVENPEKVQQKYRKFASLWNRRERGWTADVLKCVREIAKPTFSLKDVYAFEGRLQGLYPKNAFVKAKIRQQLQVLRDLKVLKFKGQGRYELL